MPGGIGCGPRRVLIASGLRVQSCDELVAQEVWVCC